MTPGRGGGRIGGGGGRARCTCQSARHFRQWPPLPLRDTPPPTPHRLGQALLGRRSGCGHGRRRRRRRPREEEETGEEKRSGEERPALGPRGRKRRRNLLLLVLRAAGRASHPATVRGCGAHARRAGVAPQPGGRRAAARAGRLSPLRKRVVGRRVGLQEPSGSSADKGSGNFLVWAGGGGRAGLVAGLARCRSC